MKNLSRTSIISTFALSAVLAAGAHAATTAKPSNTPRTPVVKAASNMPGKQAKKYPSMSGTIMSINDTSLVLSHGKKKVETSFTLNSETKREGTLNTGTRATVWYRRAGNDRIATMVRAHAPRHSAMHTKAHSKAKAS